LFFTCSELQYDAYFITVSHSWLCISIMFRGYTEIVNSYMYTGRLWIWIGTVHACVYWKLTYDGQIVRNNVLFYEMEKCPLYLSIVP
jgi:hypothetical protein